MSKVQQSRAALGSLIRQAKAQLAEAKLTNRRASGINDQLNATVVEQNERLETLAGNCGHYRQRIKELTDRESDLTEQNTKLYDDLHDAKADRKLYWDSLCRERNDYADAAAQLVRAKSLLTQNRWAAGAAFVLILGNELYRNGAFGQAWAYATSLFV
jgi:chromosome segregation ATPase